MSHVLKYKKSTFNFLHFINISETLINYKISKTAKMSISSSDKSSLCLIMEILQ